MTSQQVRQLLELYYEGQTTPEQEAALTDYFVTHPNVEADLRVDRRLFLALDRAARLAPPADLERRIVDATCGSPRRCMAIILRAAAAVAVLVAVVYGIRNISSDNRTSAFDDTQGVLEALIGHPDTLLRVDTTAMVKPVAEEPRMATAETRRVSARKVRAGSRDIEITDTAQAREVLTLLDNILARQFSAASQSIDETIESFESIENTLNKTLR